MEWPWKILASKRLSNGGKNIGGGDRQLEIGGFCSRATIFDGDLRWVPPGSGEGIF